MRFLRITLALSLLVLGFTATQVQAVDKETTAGAAVGAVTGAIVGGPVGAAAGGVFGGAVGSSADADQRDMDYADRYRTRVDMHLGKYHAFDTNRFGDDRAYNSIFGFGSDRDIGEALSPLQLSPGVPGQSWDYSYDVR